MSKETSDSVLVCMMAGPENHGKERNPMWGTCRYCCSFCSTYDCKSPKCPRESCDFCAWRTDKETLVFIDLFGEGYAREIYRENLKRRDKMVSNSSSTTTDLP